MDAIIKMLSQESKKKNVKSRTACRILFSIFCIQLHEYFPHFTNYKGDLQIININGSYYWICQEH